MLAGNCMVIISLLFFSLFLQNPLVAHLEAVYYDSHGDAFVWCRSVGSDLWTWLASFDGLEFSVMCR